MHYKKTILLLIVSVFLIVCPSLVTAGQLGDWTTLNNLNVGRYANISILAHDTIIYTLGGYSDYTIPYPVEKAIVKPDGSLTQWSIDSQAMNISRFSPVGFYYNGYIYALSGSDLVNYIGQCTTIERAKVNSDGSLGKWEYINPVLKGVMEASLVLSPPYVYLIGGWNSSTEFSNEILRGKIQPNGDISEWSVLSSSLITERNQSSAILIDSTIYVVGGYSYINSETKNIESAVIYSDGELGAFRYSGVTKASHHLPGLFYKDKYLHVIGGYSGGGNLDYCEECIMINAEGSLGDPVPDPALQYEISGFGYVQASTGGYVIGGGDSYPFVQFAPFLAPTNIAKKYWEIFENNE